jgi:uncharacterized protein YunC (DUF1805 family)
MQVEQIHIGSGTAMGIRVEMKTAPLLVITARRGFVMCGYLNMEAAEKLEDVAARVSAFAMQEQRRTARPRRTLT